MLLHSPASSHHPTPCLHVSFFSPTLSQFTYSFCLPRYSIFRPSICPHCPLQSHSLPFFLPPPFFLIFFPIFSPLPNTPVFFLLFRAVITGPSIRHHIVDLTCGIILLVAVCEVSVAATHTPCVLDLQFMCVCDCRRSNLKFFFYLKFFSCRFFLFIFIIIFPSVPTCPCLLHDPISIRLPCFCSVLLSSTKIPSSLIITQFSFKSNHSHFVSSFICYLACSSALSFSSPRSCAIRFPSQFLHFHN